MPFAFSLSDIIPATPQQIYDAWLDSGGHSRMTGGKARISAREGADFSAWDGYITGKNLKLEPGRRIVQSWRSSEFASQDADSRIEVLLEPVAGGTRITLTHSNVPDGHTSYRDGGWQDYYFAPMKKHFERASSKPGAPKRRRRPSR
jgi:activator of HSP90 ATPase